MTSQERAAWMPEPDQFCSTLMRSASVPLRLRWQHPTRDLPNASKETFEITGQIPLGP